ncbi:MAG: tetratricopeptide repeat protein [Woeseia sp.]|nr:tetratricopeptide repeat protein [Woeseia sp.]MBT8095908.1 tetratricopeptide repeat protein [Woeseia sp.]NNE61102.1 tetratricopeptide repeat protein [Woeseia sp.]NNL54875.1 tetratricopeptide repeat protein [Woeseia sp.]
MSRAAVSLLLVVALSIVPVVTSAKKKPPTIKSLEGRSIEVPAEREITASNERARDNYREFLDLVSEDPLLRAEAMRRLADLELEATEAQQLSDNVGTLDQSSFASAVALFKSLLESYPDYRRNDTVLYQLARAYEVAGQTDESLATLNELVTRYPTTSRRAEIEFRRGEMLFLRKNYGDAERAYQHVVAAGEGSRFYVQSLYKLGWAQFKLARHEASFGAFFALLDHKLRGIDFLASGDPLAVLGRADRELVDDTLRVVSISCSYLDGPLSMQQFFASRPSPGYSYLVYRKLGDLYLEKERFVDAAKTYEAFAAENPTHPRAPQLQAAAIDANQQGGFASLVLEAKQNFVERYGLDQAFWQHNVRAGNENVIDNLKANLTDLAQYFHAEAQRDAELSDYQQAARWYRKFLEYFPDETGSAATNFLLAEILFESADFAAATDEYERSAYDYPEHERSAEAAYAAILAYRRHEAELSGDAKSSWHARYLDSGLRFADAFPQHPESNAVLTVVAEDLFAQQQFDLAIVVAQSLVKKQPPAAAAMLRTAWTVIAHAQFDLGQFDLAEHAYYALREYTPTDDSVASQEIDTRIASAIYKQGEAARERGALETAVGHFQRVAAVVPDATIRATAEYDAAAALMKLQAWDRASAVLLNLRSNFPNGEYADDVTKNLALAYRQSGRTADAAAEFERIAMQASPNDEVRREALWHAIDLYKDGKNSIDEERVLEILVAQYPEPFVESFEARARLLELAEQRADVNLVRTRLQDLQRADAMAGSERTERSRYLAALASLRLAEPLRQRFSTTRITQPLASSLTFKKSMMEELVSLYGVAIDYAVEEVTTAATFRLGEAYEQFALDLMQSERPADLDALALEEYDLLLEEQAFPFEEKAIDFYKVNAARATDGIYDEWVQRSFAALAELMPARYAKQERSEDVVTALY